MRSVCTPVCTASVTSSPKYTFAVHIVKVHGRMRIPAGIRLLLAHVRACAYVSRGLSWSLLVSLRVDVCVCVCVGARRGATPAVVRFTTVDGNVHTRGEYTRALRVRAGAHRAVRTRANQCALERVRSPSNTVRSAVKASLDRCPSRRVPSERFRRRCAPATSDPLIVLPTTYTVHRVRFAFFFFFSIFFIFSSPVSTSSPFSFDSRNSRNSRRPRRVYRAEKWEKA